MEGEFLVDQPLSHKLIKKGSRLYFFMMITAPVGYLIRVIVSNQLSVEDIGVFYSIIGFITLISMYHDLGLTEALQYFLPKYRIEKKYNNYKTILYITLLTQIVAGVIIAGIIYFSANRLAINHFHSPQATIIIKTLCRYFIGINFLQVFNSIYVAFQDSIASSLTDFFRVYGILAFTLIFWFTNGLDITNFSVGRISGLGIGLIISSIIFFRKYWKTLSLGKVQRDTILIKKQFSYAFRIFLGANVMSLLGQVDQQLVINFLGSTAAGYYSNYLSLITMYYIIISPILALLFPIVTELITKNKQGELSSLQNTLYKYFSLLALSIGGLFFCIGPEIATILFGTKFTYSGNLLVWSGPFLVIHVLFVINYYILAGLGKVKERVKILGLAVLVNILCNILFILVFHMGLLGAVFSMMLGWIILFYFSYRVINTHQKIIFDRRFLIKNIMVIVGISGLVFIYKYNFFILENTFRYKNIIYMVFLLCIYYGILGMVNYKSFIHLRREIKVLRNFNK